MSFDELFDRTSAEVYTRLFFIDFIKAELRVYPPLYSAGVGCETPQNGGGGGAVYLTCTWPGKKACGKKGKKLAEKKETTASTTTNTAGLTPGRTQDCQKKKVTSCDKGLERREVVESGGHPLLAHPRVH